MALKETFDKDQTWLRVIHFFEKMNEHGHSLAAILGLIGAMRQLGAEPHHVEAWIHLHFGEEMKDIWFKEIQPREDETRH